MEFFLKFIGKNNPEIILPQFLDIRMQHLRDVGASEVAVVSFVVYVVVHIFQFLCHHFIILNSLFNIQNSNFEY